MNDHHPHYYVKNTDTIDRPDWAEQYGIGDTIAFRSPPDGDVETAEVIGFSFHTDQRGCPVIQPGHLTEHFDEPEPETVAITQEYHVPPGEEPADE